MAQSFNENVERIDRMSVAMKDFAAQALSEGHPILREAGLQGAASPELLEASRSQLEGIGRGAAQLEAIIKMTNRPPLAIKRGVVQLAGIELPGFDAAVFGQIEAVQPLIASIGRIEFLNHDMDWGGTGWVIGEEPGHLLVATNRHVAKIVARRTAFGTGVFLFDPGGGGQYGALIDFNEERDAATDQARPAKILGFSYLAADDAADFAIARIAVPSEFKVEPLPLSIEDGRDGEPIAVVGYPARDSRNDATHMERYFQGLYDVKRFAPGFLRVKSGATRLSHDATTLGGNSGSPVISLENGNVVGLHFSGKFAVGNSAVRVSTLEDVLRGRKTSISVPSGGQEDIEGRDGAHDATDFAERNGYDPKFLQDFNVPLPDPSSVPNISLVAPSDASAARKYELRYQHFGVLYCSTYRSPVVAAVNIDGARAMKFKRGSDRWFYDLRIARELQIGSEAYSDAGVDRGHMVRREDPNWGDDIETVRRANFDTFHFTNCSPQHGRFNRNIETWQGLENYLLESTRTHGFRACIFTGPVLADDLDRLDDFNLFLPREYWKVVVMPVKNEAGNITPHATAYLLSQGQLIQKLLQDRGDTEAVEGFAFGEYKTFQVAIGTLEKLTGVNFGELRNFDPLLARESLESPLPPYIAVQNLAQLQM